MRLLKPPWVHHDGKSNEKGGINNFKTKENSTIVKLNTIVKLQVRINGGKVFTFDA